MASDIHKGTFAGTAYVQRGNSSERDCVCCKGEHIFSKGITFEENMPHGLQYAILDLFDKEELQGKKIIIEVYESSENG